MTPKPKSKAVRKGVPVEEWRWFGWARHLIVGSHCRFHMATEIGDYLVSTVGEHFPDAHVREIFAQSRGVTLEGRGDAREYDYMKKIGFEDIGYGRKYETMVFPLSSNPCRCEKNCGAREVADFGELDSLPANESRIAMENHMTLCRKYARRAQRPDEKKEK